MCKSNKIFIKTRHPELDSGSHQLCKLTRFRNAPSWVIGSLQKRGFAHLDVLGSIATRRTCRNPIRLCGMTRVGFTLAEVLITLGIIGVVAAMTIPTVMSNVQERSTVTALKKAYSTLSQAYSMAVQENGTPDEWGFVPGDLQGNSEIALNKIAPYLKIIKNCNRNPGCIPVSYKTGSGSTANYDSNQNNAKAIWADGMYIVSFVSASYENCNYPIGTTPVLKTISAEYYIDVNGAKSPNEWGKDIFLFYLSKDGIVPAGSQQQTIDKTFTANCAAANSAKVGCAAWVIYNENMDYLKCGADLSWGGKTKCD